MVHRPGSGDVADMVSLQRNRIESPIFTISLGKWMYTHTVRKQEGGEVVETRTNISRQIYDQLLSQAHHKTHFFLTVSQLKITRNTENYHVNLKLFM